MVRSQSRASARTPRPHAAQTVAEMMQDAADQTGHEVRDSLQRGMDAASKPFAALGENAFETWMRGSNEALRRVIELNAELALWSREQLDDSMRAVQSMSQCRSFGDAYSVQLGLARASMETSLRHVNKVLSLTAHAMAAGAGSARPAAG